MSDDFDFQIKRKKPQTLLEEKKQKITTINPITGEQEIKPIKKKDKDQLVQSKIQLPFYSTDKVITEILKEAKLNFHFFNPLKMILSQGKKDLVNKNNC